VVPVVAAAWEAEAREATVRAKMVVA